MKKNAAAILALLIAAVLLITGGCTPKNGSDPVVNAPTDVPAETELPATDEPEITEIPAPTDVPATEIPATEAPATEAPATDEPATELPATDIPATEVPASATPVPTDVPTPTKVPATATNAPTPTPTPAPTPKKYDEPNNVFRSWDADTVKTFTRLTSKQTTVELTDEGVKLNYIKSNGADPFVFLDIAKYAEITGKPALSGKQGSYVVIKMKSQNCDGDFEVFTHKPAAGDSARSAYVSDGNWHYIFVDMTSTKLTQPDTLTTIRFDWSGISTRQDATMTISEVSFYDDYKAAMTAAGLGQYVLKDSSGLSAGDSLSGSTLKANDEDSSVKIWFEQTTEKVYRNVTSPSSLTGYTVRMAKNEVENAQFIVAPGREMQVRIEIDEFSDGNGNKLSFELAYEYYHNINGKFIPDGLIPYTGPVKVAASNSQGFMIRVTTTPETKAGTYNSVIHVYDDATGKEVRRAPVAVKVWNFALSEETELRTAFGLWMSYVNDSYPDSRWTQEEKRTLEDNYYDFFLKYRINIMDMPHGLTSGYAAKKMLDPRINTVRWRNLDMSIAEDNNGVTPEWIDEVIYYTVDEPGARNNIYTDLTQLVSDANRIRANTPGFRMVCPLERNIDLTADGHSTSFANSVIDSIGFMEQATNIWCVKPDAFTPRELMFVKGATSLQSIDQDIRYGTFAQRMKNRVAQGDELWMYIAINPTEPFVNWQMLSDGTETITSLWQMKMLDVTGLLYWAVDYWKVNYWGSSPWTGSGYGDGILIYSGHSFGLLEPIPTMRLESIRDGIEDYQMLSMLEKKLGKDAVNDIISYVTTSVVTYTRDDDVIHAARVLLGDTLEKALNS